MKRRILTAVAAAALTLTATPAHAAPTTWKWGGIHSTDGWATAWGKITVGQSGHRISGNLDDSRGRTCSWLLIKSMSATNGRWRTHGIYNCVAGTGTFTKNLGGVLQIRAQVCRGTAKKPVNKCSKWKTIWTQGG
ncbi:hypothetical protein GT755_09410 [Herbidospora sp. NEAU-GS84]|uniref:Uncharacterized protein n=1 Tax=Herbidospora solisilvae TaxID=2696284 RepID=A0A7C9J2G9_9ACTN|nr:hypothetical protein [Herbidospora solisilvae]NAS21900.1 hypothetical protein [Herbidospora solisilvae]